MLAVVGITFAAMYPSLLNGFSGLDDPGMLTHNTTIMSLSWQNIYHMFTTIHLGLYHPLVLISYAIEFHFFKFYPGIYHATNLFLHLMNCLLVFRLFSLVTADVAIAGITALLFGIHPMHVESVAWVTERKDVLYAFFYLYALIQYVRYYQTGKWQKLWFSFGLFACSLLSKPMAITLPGILVLLDYQERRPITTKLVLEKVPFVTGALLFGFLAIVGHSNVHSDISFMKVAGNVVHVPETIVFYLTQLTWPVKLSAIYNQFPLRPTVLGMPYWIYTAGVLSILAAVILYAARHTRMVMFGALFFLVAITPVLQIVPVGWKIPADRYVYIAALGYFVVIAVGYVTLFRQVSLLWGKIMLVFFGIVIIGISVSLSRERCRIWGDDLTLYTDAITKYPVNIAAYNNRGLLFFKQKMNALALRDYDTATSMNPSYPLAYLNRGYLFGSQRDYQKARVEFKKAIACAPHLVNAYINLGNTYAAEKKYDKAFICFKKALHIEPNNWETLRAFGNVFLKIGDTERAMDSYRHALKSHPFESDVLTRMGMIMSHQKKFTEALSFLNRAVDVDPGYSNARMQRGIVYEKLCQPEKALADLFLALSLDETQAVPTWYLIGDVLFMNGQYESSITWFSKSIERDAQYSAAYARRSAAYVMTGKFSEARADIRTIEKITGKRDQELRGFLEQHLSQEELQNVK
jgi:tetratricopeptide (TPR) repeat protein